MHDVMSFEKKCGRWKAVDSTPLTATLLENYSVERLETPRRTRCKGHRRFIRRAFQSMALCGLAVVNSPASGAGGDVVRATLENGLRVVIVRDALAPVVATSVNYQVGSAEAPPGFPGTAHAEEHMMFRGSPALSGEQLAVIGSLMGGDFNANTRENVTQYLFTVPAADIDVALRIEATRMRGVLNSTEGWDRERGAIEQEVAQDLSNPAYQLYAKLRALMFAGTPYAHDALGTKPSFDNTSASMLKRFHDTWYAPNNGILVVVGDLDPAAVLKKIQALFGSIARKPLPSRRPIELAPLAPSSLRFDTDQPVGTEMLAMRVPGLDSPDFPAFELLSDVLSSHRFELYDLVPQGLAIDADFTLDPLPQASLAYAAVSFSAGTDSARLGSRVRAILEHVAKSGVPPQLLEAAKIQERRAAQFEKNSIAGLASVWSDAIAVYGLEAPDDELARLEKVTVADVNRVARRYLSQVRVTATLVPQANGRPVAGGGGFGGKERIALGEATATPLPRWARDALDDLRVPAPVAAPTVSTLANGLTLIVQPETISDTVSVFGHIRNRPEMQAEPGQSGIASLLEQLFEYGSESRDRLQFAAALDDIGAEEHAGTDFGVSALSNNFEAAVALLAENELHAALPAAAFSVVAQQLVRIVDARNRSPGYLAQRSLLSMLYPADDPSLREATPATLGSVTLDDVRAYYGRTFRPDMTSIVVIGKVSPELARRIIEKYFGGWTAQGAAPDIELPTAPPNQAATTAVPDASRVQDSVVLAQNLAMTRQSPDYYALELGNAVLAGGFYATRLSIELRKKLGLVYSVDSSLHVGRTRGVYFVDYACDPANVERADGIVVQELKNMQLAPPTADELLTAKSLLVRQIPLHESSVQEIAYGLLARRDLGLPFDEPAIAARHYIELTGAEVQAAFRNWIRPDQLVRVTQGPAPREERSSLRARYSAHEGR